MNGLDVLACLQEALREAHAIDDTLLEVYPEVTRLRVLLDEAHHCLQMGQR